MTDRYEDERGVIQDLFDGGPVDAVTWITTNEGAVRGNHFHKLTTQWTYVLSGLLLVVSGDGFKMQVGPFEAVKHEPGDPHAWKALRDTTCLVFTRGPRSGEGYESDTYRLEEPLL
jgi:quercetin dioxygenase-like cupin family protein